METPRNEQVWRKAKRRAAFKMHLRSYLIINTGLWLIYAITNFATFGNDVFPWPVFPMLGWGIGLAMHYFTAYRNLDEQTIAQKEYEKLMRG
ncbi:2TM domain-containing protein [Dyadobacter sp. CY323]|uniref:2TM domain-containing protein n=1 Tax=Dyadobacter sp. CY323 TaxID=2907302 RepID=UPI001F1D9B8C|nr:2TM domain-containing protein [Dyadobacter sp. CY323]MCE6992683.1 2TM domain-containing protein [Dyadobacter sp. CY323]